MATSEPVQTPNISSIPVGATLHRIRFAPDAGTDQERVQKFVDPSTYKPILALVQPEPTEKNPKPVNEYGIDILTVPSQPNDHLGANDDLLKWVAEPELAGTVPPTAITVHGAQVIWSPSRAAIRAALERSGPFLLALVDFSYYENELRKLEREVSESWPTLEQDGLLAYNVPAIDPDRFEDVGQRMEQALKRRIRLAQIIPFLLHPRAHLPMLANQLMERLRERVHVEERQTALIAQLEVFERIYEMNSQRISEFKAAKKEQMLEWIIIVLLAAESLFLLVDLLKT